MHHFRYEEGKDQKANAHKSLRSCTRTDHYDSLENLLDMSNLLSSLISLKVLKVWALYREWWRKGRSRTCLNVKRTPWRLNWHGCQRWSGRETEWDLAQSWDTRRHQNRSMIQQAHPTSTIGKSHTSQVGNEMSCNKECNYCMQGSIKRTLLTTVVLWMLTLIIWRRERSFIIFALYSLKLTLTST